ncbi:MAG: hypothetical protein M9890_12770 [Thermomicrobiales bacterium]|nr:hypothetical protein [Thermomicrobiales bacterium]
MSTSAPDEQPTDAPQDGAEQPDEQHPMESDDYLVPGPTAESNAGLARWGITWLVFSILLMLVMLGITVVCYFIGTWLNLG